MLVTACFLKGLPYGLDDWPLLMSQTNVSSCVLSIVASFTSGLDVLKRLSKHGHSKRLKRSHNASLENEVRLRRSLQQGPEEIGREYQRGLHAAGNQQEHFARGDSLAQNTLAEILLKLNTGLVAIINTFLSKGKQDAPLDYSSLTDLSERSRQDTCRTLRKLYQRMRIGLPKRFGNEQAHRRAEPRSRSNVSRASRTNCDNEAKMKGAKVRGPMLARVVVANSSRPSVVAMVRPAEGRKTSASSTASSRSQLNALPTSPIRSAYLPHSLSTQRSRAAITAPRNKGSATELGTCVWQSLVLLRGDDISERIFSSSCMRCAPVAGP